MRTNLSFPVTGHCCTTPTGEDSHSESMRLDRQHDEAFTRPLPHDEMVQLQCFSAQARGRPLMIDANDGRADETKRPVAGNAKSSAHHPREQAKKLFPSRDFH